MITAVKGFIAETPGATSEGSLIQMKDYDRSKCK
jgi:hypothetical protein